MARTALIQCVALIILLSIWEGIVAAGFCDPFFLPPPHAIGSYLVDGFSDGTLVAALSVTTYRLVLGFLIGLVFGVPFGFLIAYSRIAGATLGVLALGFQALPSVCWIPLALLWFGQSEWAVLFVVVMGTLWSIAIAVGDGIKTIPPIYERAARTMGARSFSLVYKVVLPAALPVMLTGVKQGWAFAWRSLLAAEIFVTILSGFGLGQLLHYGRELHAMEQVFGVMLLIIAIGLVTDLLIIGSIQRAIHRRWGLRTVAT